MTRRRIISLIVVSLILTACGGGDDGPESATLLVFVDERVQGPATALVDAFHEDNPGVRLEVEIGKSQELADRIRAGEGADIVIGERPEVDQLAAEEVTLGETLLFGTELLEIAVPAGNPANVLGLDAFLPDSPIRSAICLSPSVCGDAARRVLTAAGIPVDGPDRTDANAISLLGQLANRELDAAILLSSQRASAPGQLDTVRIPLEYEERREYSVAGIEDNPTVERTVRWLATDPVAGELLVERGLREATEESGS